MEIKEIVMRIPGIPKHEAGQIAHEVNRAMGQHAWRWPSATIDDLHLRIQRGSGERSREALVAQIVNAMIQAIDGKLGTVSTQ